MSHPNPSAHFLAGRRNQFARRDPMRVVNMAREYTVEAIQTLATIMNDATQFASVRVRCCELLLERGYGKAPQAILVSGDAKDTQSPLLPIMERVMALREAQNNPGSVAIDLEASEQSEVVVVETLPDCV